ncbi:hypothetical protein J2W42_005103 [Rhizobium tibeticum]|uniref:hypothetical protein n=1 Tax=Rhizobium tibeticum TaxID=501024 RepID=UPI002781675A|nr:hypothetical protein [Rhizobium tibeticum]MDP9812233.1 hypothetical protein [Rhizobium tibeticum]
MTITWYNPGGGEPTEEQWADAGSTTIGLRISRDHDDEEAWDDVLILFDPHNGTRPVRSPGSGERLDGRVDHRRSRRWLEEARSLRLRYGGTQPRAASRGLSPMSMEAKG